MSDTTGVTTTPQPDVPVPASAVKVGDWTDVDTPDVYRTLKGARRGVGGNFVEALAIQLPDGTLEGLEVRAQLDVWQHTFHQHWDHPLTPDEARRWASKLTHAAHELGQLASAFCKAADELDGWVQR